MSLLNYAPYLLTRLHPLRVLVPHVLHVLRMSMPHVSGALLALVPNVPRALRAFVISGASCPFMLRGLRALRTFVPHVPRALRAHVLHLLFCLTCSSFFVPCVFYMSISTFVFMPHFPDSITIVWR